MKFNTQFNTLKDGRGASSLNVPIESPYDILEAIAEEFAEMGQPVSQLAIDEANRLYQRYTSQIKGAKRKDFAKLSEIIQLNLWESTHPNFNESLVDEFLKKFPTGLSNDVIKLLDAITDDALYYHVYGEQEARRAEQTVRFFDIAVQKMIKKDQINKSIWAKPNGRRSKTKH